MAEGKIYVASESFVVDGYPPIVKGQTRVRAGHPLLAGRQMFFTPLEVHYEFETATAAPGEKRAESKKPVRARKAKAEAKVAPSTAADTQLEEAEDVKADEPKEDVEELSAS